MPKQATHLRMEQVSPYFRLPQNEAAQSLGVSVSTLKRFLKRHSVRWPTKTQRRRLNQEHEETTQHTPALNERLYGVVLQLEQLEEDNPDPEDFPFLRDQELGQDVGSNGQEESLVDAYVGSTFQHDLSHTIGPSLHQESSRRPTTSSSLHPNGHAIGASKSLLLQSSPVQTRGHTKASLHPIGPSNGPLLHQESPLRHTTSSPFHPNGPSNGPSLLQESPRHTSPSYDNRSFAFQTPKRPQQSTTSSSTTSSIDASSESESVSSQGSSRKSKRRDNKVQRGDIPQCHDSSPSTNFPSISQYSQQNHLSPFVNFSTQQAPSSSECTQNSSNSALLDTLLQSGMEHFLIQQSYSADGSDFRLLYQSEYQKLLSERDFYAQRCEELSRQLGEIYASKNRSLVPVQTSSTFTQYNISSAIDNSPLYSTNNFNAAQHAANGSYGPNLAPILIPTDVNYMSGQCSSSRTSLQSSTSAPSMTPQGRFKYSGGTKSGAFYEQQENVETRTAEDADSNNQKV